MGYANSLNNLFLRIISGVKLDNVDWDALECALNQECDECVAKLRSNSCTISEMDIRIYMTKKLGLTWRQMSEIFFLDPESVRKRHQRLKRKIQLF